MLASRQAGAKTADIDKENEGSERPKGGVGGTTSGVLSKRQHTLLATPVNNQRTVETHTPASVSRLKHPILRDITNSSNPARISNDVYPALPQSGRQPIAGESASASKRSRNSKPAIESKLRLLAAPPSAIEELLSLSDEQLPEIEGPAAPIKGVHSDEGWQGLPAITDITDTVMVEAMDEVQARERRVARRLQEQLGEAIRRLVLEPTDFDEKWMSAPASVGDAAETVLPGCYMFDDLPTSVALKL